MKLAIITLLSYRAKSLIERLGRLLSVNRAWWLTVCSLTGATAGFFSAVNFGRNLPPASVAIPELGIIHRIALPRGVIKRSDIWSMELRLDGGDDFVRAYINNYIVASNEHPELLFHFWDLDQKGKDKAQLFLRRHIVNRGHNRGLRKLDFYLREGLNHLVIELENRTGPCGTRFELRVNDTLIRGIPTDLPVNPTELDNLLRRTRVGQGPRPNLQNAMCARRILQFTLE